MAAPLDRHAETKLAVNTAVAAVAAALGHPGRLALLDLLAQAERSVDRLAELTGSSMGTTSAQLRVLREARLVTTRREGTRIVYALAGDEVLALLQQARAVARMRLAEVDALLDAYHRDHDALEQIGADELLERMARDEIVLVDVRPGEEYQAGHIPGARSIPLEELEARLGEIPADREVVAYCRGPLCLLAPEAVQLIRAHGRRARRLDAGIPEWTAEARPVSRSGS